MIAYEDPVPDWEVYEMPVCYISYYFLRKFLSFLLIEVNC